MSWAILLERKAEREIEQLDQSMKRRIFRFLFERLAKLDDPRSIGEALRGAELGEFWKYRVGDYRIIARIEDKKVEILIVRVGNRREVYR
jgi:mRNA interferase RelE/StbE